MRANRVGRSSVFVSEMGLGTAQLGDLFESIDQDEANRIVGAAWDSGVRYFDTAPHYGLGLAESRLGVALRHLPRQEYILSTKVGRLLVSDTKVLKRKWDFSPSGVTRSLEESLERLQLDTIDVALIHDPQGRMVEALDQAYPVLERLRAAGVVRAIGVGSGNLEALEIFARNTDIDAAMVAGRLTLLEQPAAARLIPICNARGISVLNAGIFNTGLLAANSPDAASRYEYVATPPELLARARSLAVLARRYGTSLPQAALKFAARETAVASVVIGADSAAQVTRNATLLTEPKDMSELWDELESQNLIPYKSVEELTLVEGTDEN